MPPSGAFIPENLGSFKKKGRENPCPAYMMETKEEELLLRHLDRLYRDVALVVGCAFDNDFVTDVLLR